MSVLTALVMKFGVRRTYNSLVAQLYEDAHEAEKVAARLNHLGDRLTTAAKAVANSSRSTRSTYNEVIGGSPQWEELVKHVPMMGDEKKREEFGFTFSDYFYGRALDFEIKEMTVIGRKTGSDSVSVLELEDFGEVAVPESPHDDEDDEEEEA